MAKNSTSQKQFRGGYIPQESVQPHSMENREANPVSQRRRMSIQMGSGAEARPGIMAPRDRKTGQAGSLKKRGR